MCAGYFPRPGTGRIALGKILHTIAAVCRILSMSDKREVLPTVFTYQDARRAGISNRKLYELRNAGLIEPLGPGLYAWPDGEPMDLDLAEIAHRLKKPTLALETALAHHGLIDSIPPLIHVAIPRGSHRAPLKAPVRLHTFAPETFDIGREVLTIGDALLVGIYSPARSIIDMARLRHHESSDLLWDALRRWLRQPENSPNDLLKMARQFSRAEKPLREALEIIL